MWIPPASRRQREYCSLLRLEERSRSHHFIVNLAVRQKYRKIVIRTPNWLGDLIMSTAFIKAAMDRFPQAEIDLIVKRGLETIPLPHRGRILPFDKKRESLFEFGNRLRKENYDAAYLLSPSLSSALMVFWAGIPVRIGYSQNGRSPFLKPAKRYRRKHKSQHLIREYLQLLDVDDRSDAYYPNLSLENGWSDQTLADFGERIPGKYIVLAPGATYGPAKQWPIDYFRQVAISMRSFPVRVVVVGTQSDYESGERIVENLDRGKNLCGKTDLPELIALLEKSSLLVSNDSGVMHIMSALRKNQIALFGSTSTTWTGPANPNAVVLQEKLECSPCLRRKCPYGHYDCLKRLRPDAVAEKMQRLLQFK